MSCLCVRSRWDFRCPHHYPVTWYSPTCGVLALPQVDLPALALNAWLTVLTAARDFALLMLCVSVCACACMYVHVCVHACVHVCMHTCVCTWAWVCVFVWVCICIHVQVCVCVCVCVCTACLCSCVCVVCFLYVYQCPSTLSTKILLYSWIDQHYSYPFQFRPLNYVVCTFVFTFNWHGCSLDTRRGTHSHY